MGLFSSREDKIKKIEDELANFDDELTYKKVLLQIQNAIDGGNFNGTDPSLVAAYLIHHDLQEIKKAIEEK